MFSCSGMSSSVQPHGLYLPGSSVHGVWILEWVTTSHSNRFWYMYLKCSLPTWKDVRCIFKWKTRLIWFASKDFMYMLKRNTPTSKWILWMIEDEALVLSFFNIESQLSKHHLLKCAPSLPPPLICSKPAIHQELVYMEMFLSLFCCFIFLYLY